MQKALALSRGYIKVDIYWNSVQTRMGTSKAVHIEANSASRVENRSDNLFTRILIQKKKNYDEKTIIKKFT